MNEIITKRIDSAELDLDIRTVNRYLQIRRSSSEYDTLQRMIIEMYENHKSAVNPAWQYRVLKVKSTSSEDSSVLLEDHTKMQGVGIYRLLSKSQYAAVFVATIGSKIDTAITGLQKHDMLAGYCLEGVASTLVTSLLERVKLDLDKIAAGLSCKVGYRYAPGYAHWNLEEQAKVFSVLRPNEIGVSLTGAYYVTPRNSLTGIFGLISAK